MRIAVLTNAFPPQTRGGAGQIAKLQADWLAAHGHDVHAFTVEPFAADAESPIQVTAFKPRTSAKFAALGKTPAVLRLLFHLEDLAPNLAAVDAIRNWKPDVLLTHNVTGCGWGTARILKESGLRWLHVLHDVQMFEPSGLRYYGESNFCCMRKWRKFWSARRKRAFGLPDAVISPTRWLLEQHRANGLFRDATCEVVPNPMPTNEVRSTECGVRDLRDDVIYIGRLAEDKGADLLLAAWNKLETKPGRLVLVGDGPLRDGCGSLDPHSVECVGQLGHADAMERLACAKLLVMPSRVMENQPTVLLEAVALGKPVVAADVGGVRETLDGYGTLFKPNDAEDLARALRDKKTYDADWPIGRRLIERHNQDRVMGRLTELLSK